MGKWFSIIVLAILPMMLAAQPEVYSLNDTNLYTFEAARWQYSLEDQPEFSNPNYNDSSWETNNTYIHFSNFSDFEGICWFRVRLSIDSTLAVRPVALRFKHKGAIELFVDGVLTSRYGVINGEDSSEYYNPQRDPLIVAFDTVGQHVIAIRYANYMSFEDIVNTGTNSIGFNVSMALANNAVQNNIANNFTQGFLTIFLVGLCVALFLLHLFLFLYYREERSNLYFSLFCLSLGFLFLLPYLSVYSHDVELNMKLGYGSLIAASALCASLSGLSNILFAKKKTRFYIILALSVLLILIGWYSYVTGWVAFAVLILIVLIESFVLTIKAIIRKVKGARIIGIGILFFSVFFLGIIILGVSLAIPNGGIYIQEQSDLGQVILLLGLVAILSIPISMSVYLAWKFGYITKNLDQQLIQVKQLSEKTIAQEQEKKHILENQKHQLEEEVAERTKEIVEEKKKSDDLLRNILPEEVANELKEKGTTEAKYYDHVSVLFTDFVDFTKAGERFTPQELVNELHTCFKEFDRIISKYGIEKIKTIGDAYLAVCGLPQADEHHAEKTIQAAIEIRNYMREHKRQFPDKTFDVRIGIHNGPVVAGIVGVKKFAYDIWGDTVNTAARMESSSEADKINISHHTYELVQEQYNCTFRGKITAKNKGEMRMYFVEGKK